MTDWASPNPASQAVLERWQALQDVYQQTQAQFVRLGLADESLLIPCPGPDRLVYLRDLVAVQSEDRRSRDRKSVV